MKKIIIALGVMVLAVAAEATSLDLTPQADVDVRSTAASEDIGYNRNVLVISDDNVDPTVALDAKAYIRFQLPSDFGTATSATFTMTRALARDDAWTYSVYGLNVGPIAGSIWTSSTWPEVNGGNSSTATTWNNAPGNVTTSATDFTDSSVLGTFTTLDFADGGVTGDSYSINGTDLVNFLNAKDDNGYVTLMVSRAGISSTQDQWASKENGTYSGPILSLNYTPVPEPGSVFFLLFGGLAMLLVFNRRMA